MTYTLGITPFGHLQPHLEDKADSANKYWLALKNAFDEDSGCGLQFLANETMSWKLSSSWNFWRGIGIQYMRQLCITPAWNLSRKSSVALPDKSMIDRWVAEAPPMSGLEYLNAQLIREIWQRINDWIWGNFLDHGETFDEFIANSYPNWHRIGHVTFHLAENKGDVSRPFAFMATYANRVSQQDGKIQYLPLAKALQQYAGKKNRRALITLLSPVRLAAEKSSLARKLVDSKNVFKPLAWKPQDAYQFLKDIPIFEESGLVVKVPDWWSGRKSAKVSVNVTIGDKKANAVGLDAMLDFSSTIALGDETLTEAEWQQISQSTDGLVYLKGRWVEMNAVQLQEALDHWKQVETEVGDDGISFIKAMRLLSGAPISSEENEEQETTQKWSEVIAGDWLREQLEKLHNPDTSVTKLINKHLNAQLRPYQKVGLNWLTTMFKLGLGSCLADDMGLGKTIQVIALLLILKLSDKKSENPTLLVVPTSLIANWQAELKRFAPMIKLFIAHPSETNLSSFQKLTPELNNNLSNNDVVITTYGQLLRLDWLSEFQWNLLVLDEAQAIKNPGTKQTRAVKKIPAKGRIILTGTPVENRLSDLWSLFDFINPGMLGNRTQFKTYVKQAESQTNEKYRGLRNLVNPYILRRLKTDKTIIQDLPDKTEMRTFCNLSKKQTVLYKKSIDELAAKLEDETNADGIQRRGLVLAYLMRFKQICNHPAQLFSGDEYQSEDSGKFLRIQEICEEIASRQEKVLVFTQFKEIAQPLEQHLRKIFQRQGLILHGGTPAKKRKEYVESFQSEQGQPFFILSLKAGGMGLNLTAATHVIHFDRWWNPAVENQATDRAFRIGQKKNVIVHKFVCRGTVEEKIDAMIEEKKDLADEILSSGTEKLLTQMNDTELLNFVSLDINSAIEG